MFRYIFVILMFIFLLFYVCSIVILAQSNYVYMTIMISYDKMAICFPFCIIENCSNLTFIYGETGNIFTIYMWKAKSNNSSYYKKETYGQGYMRISPISYDLNRDTFLNRTESVFSYCINFIQYCINTIQKGTILTSVILF